MAEEKKEGIPKKVIPTKAKKESKPKAKPLKKVSAIQAANSLNIGKRKEFVVEKLLNKESPKTLPEWEKEFKKKGII